MADHYRPNYGDALDRIASTLDRIASTLEGEPARKTYWYEVSCYAPYSPGERRRVAVEAYSLDEAIAHFRLEEDRGGLVSGELRAVPLRPEQCKYCCVSDWSPDSGYCKECGYSEERGTQKRREGLCG